MAMNFIVAYTKIDSECTMQEMDWAFEIGTSVKIGLHGEFYFEVWQICLTYEEEEEEEEEKEEEKE